MPRLIRFAALITLVPLAGACTILAVPGGAGEWGGDHIRMELRRSDATIEFECAHGTIDEPIAAYQRSRFTVHGTYTSDRGGASRPARYDGRMVGDMIELTVTVLETHERHGTFMLLFRHDAHLRKCG